MGLSARYAAIALSLLATPAWTATEFGTREGELACVGLVELGLIGASSSQPSEPRVVAAMAMALGFYLGRVSKLEPQATRTDINQAINGLTLEEKNAHANLCLKKASELTAPIVK